MAELQTMPLEFRAWDKHKKEFIYKFLMSSTDDKESDDWTCHLTLGLNRKGEKDWLNNDQLVISQDTGLKDRNGKSIFFGDIVYCETYEKSVPVLYNSGLVVIRIADNEEYYISQYLDWIEVVGNIWQNPELLEK